jgi:hypothetical protein
MKRFISSPHKPMQLFSIETSFNFVSSSWNHHLAFFSLLPSRTNIVLLYWSPSLALSSNNLGSTRSVRIFVKRQHAIGDGSKFKPVKKATRALLVPFVYPAVVCLSTASGTAHIGWTYCAIESHMMRALSCLTTRIKYPSRRCVRTWSISGNRDWSRTVHCR